MLKKVTKKLLFVCTANICRSQLAKVIFDQKLSESDIFDQWQADSAGISPAPPNPLLKREVLNISQKHGYNLIQINSRLIKPEDFHETDLILTMEEAHLMHLKSVAPPSFKSQIKLFTEFTPEIPGLDKERDIPDPVGGTMKEYEYTLNLIEMTIPPLIRYLSKLDF